MGRASGDSLICPSSEAIVGKESCCDFWEWLVSRYVGCFRRRAGGFLYTIYTELPDIDRSGGIPAKLVTKVYDRHNELIGEFFIERRALITYQEIPEFYHRLIGYRR